MQFKYFPRWIAEDDIEPSLLKYLGEFERPVEEAVFLSQLPGITGNSMVDRLVLTITP